MVDSVLRLLRRIIDSAAPSQDKEDQVRASVVNVSTLIGGFLTALYAVFYAILGIELFLPLIITNVILTPIYLLPVFLNARGSYYLPKLLLLGIPSIQVMVMTYHLGTDAGVYFFYLCMPSLGLLIFRQDERRSLATVTITSGSLYFLNHYAFPVPVIPHTPILDYVLYVCSVAGTMTLVLMAIIIFSTRLRSTKLILEIALKHMPGGMLTVNTDHTVTLVNDTVSKLYDLPTNLIKEGTSLSNISRHMLDRGDKDEDGRILTEEDVARVFRSETDNSLTVNTQPGRVIELNVAPVPEGGHVAISTDITERKEAETKLKDAYEIISSSIEYASNIQYSALPDHKFLEPLTSDYFVWWEPRDVVGGDLYWVGPWGDGCLIILGDCTGHGVPGAFMTLISIGAIERAITEVSGGEVGQLITRSHQYIQTMLGQHFEGGKSDDGIELGACYFVPDDAQMKYAGARFNLFISEESDMQVIKGTKAGIGYRNVPYVQEYKEETIDLKEGQYFYMTSDGLTDQIGGERRRMFGKKRLMKLLQENRDLTMEAQMQLLQENLAEYQGDERRRDDISMIGFKF